MNKELWKEYLTFINNVDEVSTNGEKHHIYPSKLCKTSKRYGTQKDYTFNLNAEDFIKCISYRDHLIAHYKIAKALDCYSSWAALWGMLNHHKEVYEKHGIHEAADLYAEGKAEFSKRQSIKTTERNLTSHWTTTLNGKEHPNVGSKRSEESRRKMSEKAKARIRAPQSKETKNKIAEALKGQVRSKEHRNNISKAKKGKSISGWSKPYIDRPAPWESSRVTHFTINMYYYVNELYQLWLDNGKVGATRFKKLAVANGFMDGHYNMIIKWFNGSHDNRGGMELLLQKHKETNWDEIVSKNRILK